MYNPNTVTDSLDFEMTDIASEQTNERVDQYEAELPPAVQYVLDVGKQIGDYRRSLLEQEETA